MNLADKIIQANEEEERYNNGPELDDIGFPLPKPQTKKAHCEYLTARLLYLNQRMYQYNGHLWLNEHTIPETKESYYKLAKYPKPIKDHENAYIWVRVRDIIPTLDPDVIAVLPDLTFNMRTGKVKHQKVWTTTPWEGEE